MEYAYSLGFEIVAWAFVIGFWAFVFLCLGMWFSKSFKKLGETQREAVGEYYRKNPSPHHKQHRVVSATKHLPKSYGRSRLF